MRSQSISWVESWIEKQEIIANRFKSDDISRFLHWPTVRGTMHINYLESIISMELPIVQNHWSNWQEICQAPPLGSPSYDTEFDGVTCHYIHQAYLVARYEMETGNKIQDMSKICEYGPGYGAMPIILSRVGFSGKYYLHDIPGTVNLSAYYLLKNAPVNFRWQLGIPYMSDLVIAVHSLNESSKECRDRFWNSLYTDKAFVVYSEADGQWKPEDDELPGYSIPVVHTPPMRMHFYGQDQDDTTP